MSDSKDLVLETMRKYGLYNAQNLQTASDDMTGTAIIEQWDFIPAFSTAVNVINRTAGYLVKTELGNVCKLLTPYDSDIYQGQPEEYPSLWGFKYSTDPDKAKPFLALSTSPYGLGECCLDWPDDDPEDVQTYRSTFDGFNVWRPTDALEYWEVVTDG